MPYSASDLTTIYTNTQVGIAPTAAVSALLAAYAAQDAQGTLTDAQTLNAVLALATPTTAVALETYQFFTGATPTAAGLAFLVNSPTNATDLNDPYYAQFNTVNRFINFAANLGTGQGAGAASFTSTYGALSQTDAVNVAYETIIGSGNATARGIDPNAGKAYIASQIPYFTAFARQNNPTATAAQLDLIIKAEIVGYTLEEATKAGVGSYAIATQNLLADLGPDNIATLNSNLLTTYGATVASGAATLTAGTDILQANVFNAPVVFSPGGDVRLNSLQDEDQLTGTGTNPTLNFTFGNPGADGGQTITPVLNNIQTVNVAFTGSGAVPISSVPLTNPVLDLQDATGVQSVNLSRISNTQQTAAVLNLQAEPTTISVTDTQAPATAVFVNTLDPALAGAANATGVTFANANVQSFTNQGVSGNAANGVELMTITSTKAANFVGALNVAGLQQLAVNGNQNITLGATNVQVLNPTAAAGTQSEAIHYQDAFTNETGTLKSVDASQLTGAIDVSFGNEAAGGSVSSSGQSVAFSFKGGSGNDIVRLTGSLAGDATADGFDGGTGVNTLSIAPNNTSGQFVLSAANPATFANFQALDLRSGQDNTAGGGSADSIQIDMSQLASITTETIRNEGQLLNLVGQYVSAAEQGTFNLNKLSVAQAANINVIHGTTGNSQIGATLINANIATDTASDTVGVSLNTGLNLDVRNNLTIAANTGTAGQNAGTGAGVGAVENYNLIDNDAESNTVRVTNIAGATGAIKVTGAGSAGTFFNLDSYFGPTTLGSGNGSNGGGGSLYGFDTGSVTTLTGVSRSGGGAVGNDDLNGSSFLTTAGNVVAFAGGSAAQSGTSFQNTSVYDTSVFASNRFNGASFDSTATADNTILRVGDNQTAGSNGGQTLKFGAGNDTVVFDLVGDTRAGLTISDSVDGGLGNDVLVIDGQGAAISLGASEFTNVAAFEALRLVGNGIGANNARNTLNSYNISLTNDFVTRNSGGTNITNIINDDNAFNDVGRSVTALGTSITNGLTLDGRTLDATHSFNYNGEEVTANGGFAANAALPANATQAQQVSSATSIGAAAASALLADRFILTDPNINGRDVIDGGAVYGGNGFATNNTATGVAGVYGTSNFGNNDVIEVRDAAVVTNGDLAGISNIGTLEFTNDTAVNQSSFLQLSATVVDTLVNNTRAASAAFLEVLNVGSYNNPNVAGATTTVNMDVTTINTSELIALHGNGNFIVTTTGANQNAQIVQSTAFQVANDTDAFTGTAVFTQNAQQVVIAQGVNGQAITGSNGGDVIIGGGGADTITGGLGVDTVTGGAGADRLAFSTGDAVASTNFGGGLTPVIGNTVVSDVITDFSGPTAGPPAVATDTIFLNNVLNLTQVAAGGTLTDNTYEVLQGTYANGTFTYNGTGPDSAVTFDGNFGLAGVQQETIILIGVAPAQVQQAGGNFTHT